MSSLAVVIPLYNHARYIAAALASVQAQTSPPDRILILDDGSTDESAAIAERCLRDFPAIPGEIIRQTNQGAHTTLNRGVALANDCEYIAILNSDDLWAPERLARCLELLDAAPSLSVVATGLHLIDPASVPLPEESPKMRRHRKIWTLVTRENDPLLSLAVSNFPKTTSNLVARRSFLLAHPFGPYRYVHDYHFFLQAAVHDGLALLPHDLLGYRVHTTNTIKADGRRPVVAETLRMHLDLLSGLAAEMAVSATLRQRLRLYWRRLFGNYTDFRGELFLQILAHAALAEPKLFDVATLGNCQEFTAKSDPLPV